MYDRILVPLDGSALAEGALPYAELIPSRLVYLLHAESGAGAARRNGALEAREAAARDDLEARAAPFRRQGREVELLVLAGDPAARIVEAADVDLIVMTTRGRDAGGRALFGSVADRVARTASAPVLLVRGGERAATGPPVGRVVVPLDGSALAEEALPVAAALAGTLGVPVHLVRVVEPATVAAVGGIRPPAEIARAILAAAEREAEAYLTHQIRRIAGQDVAATERVRSGAPTAELLAEIGPGDLVVMATRGRSGARRLLLGSVAERIVRRAAAPVVLVRSRIEAVSGGAPQAGPLP